MSKIIVDIGVADSAAQRLFGYYHPQLKSTPSGSLFTTYFGLRQFYIVNGADRELLTMDDPKEILSRSRKYKWKQVWDLHLKLSSVLIYNMRKYPELVHDIPSDSRIVWNNEGNELNYREQSWLEIVQKVNMMR